MDRQPKQTSQRYENAILPRTVSDVSGEVNTATTTILNEYFPAMHLEQTAAVKLGIQVG